MRSKSAHHAITPSCPIDGGGFFAATYGDTGCAMKAAREVLVFSNFVYSYGSDAGRMGGRGRYVSGIGRNDSCCVDLVSNLE